MARSFSASSSLSLDDHVKRSEESLPSISDPDLAKRGFGWLRDMFSCIPCLRDPKALYTYKGEKVNKYNIKGNVFERARLKGVAGRLVVPP